MNAVLVDDEYYALQGLKMELEEIGDIRITGLYEDPLKMLDEIAELRPDLIFLDVEMPQMDGFEVFARLMEMGCTSNVVFVTAYTQYAVRAFEINAVDYIVKPVTQARLIKTLERSRPVAVPVGPMELRFNCFRHFSIVTGGKDINAGWRTRKAAELIAFLISEGGNYTAKEKIAEALWPEQEGRIAMSNLYMAYHYINKQSGRLGFRIPIESERGKMRIDLSGISCDLLEFDRLLGEARTASREKRPALMERAAALYTGLPFEDAYFGWTGEIQGRYEYRYLELLEQLVCHFKSCDDLQNAEVYEKKLRDAEMD